jgi:hypothetical protein
VQIEITSAVEPGIEICQECRDNRSILLVQPKHILSFELIGIKCLLNGQPDVEQSLLRSQRFFNTHFRDIVDKSNETFSVKFKLVYTMGKCRGRLSLLTFAVSTYKDLLVLACQGAALHVYFVLSPYANLYSGNQALI